jgi:hypothetical protein
MGKDPWASNPARPQSMNGWSYVENNPVNLVDPLGETPFRAEYCKTAFLPSEYANCVRHEYGLKAFDFFSFETADVGFPFLGSSGCWYGPVPYRAKGYLEGTSVAVVAGVGFISGNEIVYDFATMEQQKFKYVGAMGQDAGGVTVSQYVGVISGFKTQRFGWDQTALQVTTGGLSPS